MADRTGKIKGEVGWNGDPAATSLGASLLARSSTQAQPPSLQITWVDQRMLRILSNSVTLLYCMCYGVL